MIFSHFAPNARTCPGQKPHRSDRFWCSEARMRSVSVTCAGVSAGYAHDRRGEGDRDAGLDRDMPRPAHAGSREQAEADPDDADFGNGTDRAVCWTCRGMGCCSLAIARGRVER